MFLCRSAHTHTPHDACERARHRALRDTRQARVDGIHPIAPSAPPRTTSPHARAGSHGGERVWAPQNIGLNTSAENRTGQVKILLQSSISHAEEHWATLLRARAGRAARHGRNELHARRGGARESVGSAEARVRPSPRPSSALAARARATGNIGFIVRKRKGRPGKKIADSTKPKTKRSS